MKRVTEASFARWAAFLLLLTAGCSSEYAADEYAVGMAEAPGMFQDSVDAELADATEEGAAGSETVPSPDAALETDRQLIYVADVRLVVNDFAAVEGKNGISQLIEKYGGHTADLTIDRDQGEARSGQWKARIPVKNYRIFLDELRELGVPEHFRETTEDVTAQYVDLDARIRNKQRLEERILTLLDRSAGKINELIEVERELGRVRGEIEQMQSMFRSLQSRIKMTTVTINAREERGYEPPQAPSFGSRIGKAWTNSLYGIGEGIKNLIVGLVGFIPWLIVIVPAFLLARFAWRRRRED